MNDILSGTYKGNTYRIKVECYPNTPAIKVQLLPVNAGERITMTQNLGQPLPRYQAFLCDGMLEVDSTAFMDYMEENDLGYIVDYNQLQLSRPADRQDILRYVQKEQYHIPYLALMIPALSP